MFGTEKTQSLDDLFNEEEDRLVKEAVKEPVKVLTPEEAARKRAEYEAMFDFEPGSDDEEDEEDDE